MNGAYSFTPYIWSILASAAFVTGLGVYGWRRRSVPGALPFAYLMWVWALIAIGTAFELAAEELSTKILWYKFEYFWQGPGTIAAIWFVLAYARLDRYLTRRNLVILLVFVFTGSFLIITNDLHHWIWTSFTSNGAVYAFRGSAFWILTFFFGYPLALLTLPVLIWLFIRSPQQRWSVALILSGQIFVRLALLLELANPNPITPLDPLVLALSYYAIVLAVALFGFHMFNPIPVAHKTVIEQMREGMLVMDTSGKIVDLNPTAVSILDKPAIDLRNMKVADLLPCCDDLTANLDGKPTAQTEISLGPANALRQYEVKISPLTDHNDVLLGHLLLLHDITEMKRAQAQLLEQQRILATLEERERLARELHDSIGQVLAYVSMQAQTILEWVKDGNTQTAEIQLVRLAGVAQEAHEDVRESILNLKASSSQGWPLINILQQYLSSYQNRFNIHTELRVADSLQEVTFEPETEVQLLRVIQEAMTNARKHSRARCVMISIDINDPLVEIIVADDGVGFDPGQISVKEGDHYGLAFMRERLEQIDGEITIDSKAGSGTRVILSIPVREGKLYQA